MQFNNGLHRLPPVFRSLHNAESAVLFNFPLVWYLSVWLNFRYVLPAGPLSLQISEMNNTEFR